MEASLPYSYGVYGKLLNHPTHTSEYVFLSLYMYVLYRIIPTWEWLLKQRIWPLHRYTYENTKPVHFVQVYTLYPACQMTWCNHRRCALPTHVRNTHTRTTTTKEKRNKMCIGSHYVACGRRVSPKSSFRWIDQLLLPGFPVKGIRQR